MFYQSRNVGFFQKGQSGFTVLTFLIAYLFHFFALFFAFSDGMSKGDLTIEVWLSMLVFSMLQFIMLQFFAYQQANRAVWCGPYAASSYNLKQIEGKSDYQYALVEDPTVLSTAHEEVALTMIQHAEVQMSASTPGTVA